MLEKLTPEQLALIPVIRQRFIAAGLSTAPVDIEAAKTAVRDAYTVVGLKPPVNFVHLPSPWAGAKQAAIFEAADSFEAAMANPKNVSRDQIVQQINKAFYGQHDVNWLAFYQFFHSCGITGMEKILPSVRLSELVGWCWFFEDTAIITDRPCVLKRDNGNRLHCDNGPALAYSDGFAVFAWHGHRLQTNQQWIILEKAKITPEKINKESNVELRRIMLEVYGFERYLAANDATVISEDVDGNGHPRRLLEMVVAGDQIRVIEVLNGSLEPDGTRRKFILGAARNPLTREEPSTPHEAVAYSYGRPPAKYKEMVRT